MYITKWFDEVDEKEIKMLTRLANFHPVRKGRYYKGYYEIHCAFDIETTNIINKKLSFMYIWQFQLNDLTILGNKWIDFVNLLEMLQKVLKLNKTHRLIVWVHNLKFETQFMRKWLDITEVFAREVREPMYIVHNSCIEFHDSMMISGSSLEQLAKTYTKTKKLKGDLDYNVLRNSGDARKMTKKEIAYCENDVRILKEFSEFIWKTYIKPFNFLPLTKTGIVRKKIKDKVTDDNRNAIHYCYPSHNLYKLMMNYGFRGGFVHANCIYVNKTLSEIDSFDITSSYPASMYHNYFAMDKFRKVKLSCITKDSFNECVEKMSCIILISFYDVKNRTTHSIESTSKCIELVNPIRDNGRIVTCDKMTVCINQIDFKIYKMFYKWSKIEIHEMYVTRQGRLPKYLLNVLFESYNGKNELKKRGLKDTIEYKLKKEEVNSMYGCCVTKHPEYDILLNDEWESVPTSKSYEDIIERDFLLPQWGCEITSYSRYKLLKMIYDMDCLNRDKYNCNISDIIYSDTDSIKFKNGWKYYNLFNEVNGKIEKMNYELFNGNPNMLDLGTFDNESEVQGLPAYRTFKTIGAKRYIAVKNKKEKNEFESTIAGLGKQMLVTFYRKNRYKFKRECKSIFDIFADGLQIDFTGKLASCYNDEETNFNVNGELMREKSSLALYPVEFKLTLDSAWINYLNSLPINYRKL